MAFTLTRGTDAQGNAIPLPIGSKAIATSTPLQANQVWQSEVYWYEGKNNIQLALAADVPGTYTVEYFAKVEGQPVKVPFMANPVSFDPSIVSAFQAAIAGKGDGVKITFTNGNANQSTFYCEIGLLNETIQETQRSMGIPMSPTNLGGTTHAALEGREFSTGNAFKQVTGSTFANKFGLDVNVINRSNETQQVQVTNPVSVEALAKESGGVLAGILTKITSDPATQTTLAAIFSKLNAGIEIANDSGNPLPISGTVSISNLPATQPISGSVSVSNLPATQPVSAAALPLPAGAATSSNQSATNTTLASLLTSIGLPTDAPITDQTQSGSLISFIKGLLSETLAPASTGSVQIVNLIANIQQTIPGNNSAKGRLIYSTNGTIFVAFGFTATVTNYSLRITQTGLYEVPALLSLLPISFLSTTAASVNVTTTQ